MRPDVEAARQRITATRALLELRAGHRVPWQDVEDALCAGYAAALAADAWLADVERRLHQLLGDTSQAAHGREVRALASEHCEFQRGVIALRHELEALRAEHEHQRASTHSAGA